MRVNLFLLGLAGRAMAQDSKIIGGDDAVAFAHPWTVSLGIYGSGYNSHYCGGTLISPTWVVTAAHCCTQSASAYYISARLPFPRPNL